MTLRPSPRHPSPYWLESSGRATRFALAGDDHRAATGRPDFQGTVMSMDDSRQTGACRSAPWPGSKKLRTANRWHTMSEAGIRGL